MTHEDFSRNMAELLMPRQMHLEQYVGLWAMHEEAFLAGVETVRKLDLHMHLQSAAPHIAQAAADAQRKPASKGSIGIVSISGTMMKHVSSMSDGTSTVLARRAIRELQASEDVKAIVLKIDSPGGTVSGTSDLADDVAAANQQKPVYAFIEDLGASAAYWVASQAREIHANRTALVGSIGTYGVVHDLSALAAMEGIKVHVVRAGEYKGTGVPGTAVNAEQLAMLQERVNQLNEHFLAGVSKGRRLPMGAVKALADGRVHVGESALGLGLIDRVGSFDALLAQISSDLRKSSTGAKPKMTATIQELRAACPGADNDFIVGQLEAGATVEKATANWLQELATRNAALAEENEQLKAKPPETKPAVAPPASSLRPLGSGKSRATPAAADDEPAGDDRYSDAVAEFGSRVAAKVRAGTNRRAAVQQVAAADKELHQAYLLATNRGRKQQELIRDSFSMR